MVFSTCIELILPFSLLWKETRFPFAGTLHPPTQPLAPVVVPCFIFTHVSFDDILVVSTFWLLRITMLWTCVYQFTCGLLSGIAWGVELPSHMLSLYVTFCLLDLSRKPLGNSSGHLTSCVGGSGDNTQTLYHLCTQGGKQMSGFDKREGA